MAAQTDPSTRSPTVDALVQLSFAVQLALTRVATQHDLSVTGLRLLGILRDRTPAMAAIADYLELDRSSVSGLIDRSERRGLVARRTSGKDARVTLVELTDHGRELGTQLEAAVSAALEEIVASGSAADRAAVVRLAEAIAPDAALVARARFSR